MTKEEKPKQLFTHFLRCTNKKCLFSFSIDHESDNNTKIGFDKLKCPKCQHKMGLDPSKFVKSGKLSKEAQGKMNVQMSSDALRMAAEAKRRDVESGDSEMVQVTGTPETPFGRSTESIPKKVIDKIIEKVAPEIKE